MKAKQKNEPDMKFTNKKFSTMVKYSLDLIKGIPLYESQKIPKKTIDLIYSLAINSYLSGQHDNSCKLFQLLCIYDHTNPRHFLGIGSCLQTLNKIPEACLAYQSAIRLKPYSYNSHFNLSQCLLKVGNVADAITSLENVVYIGKLEPDVQKKNIYIKAKNMLEILKKSHA